MDLPPLNALKAFEAAARLGSFARAADELNVTAGAISRHIRLLEEHLDAELFERLTQGVQVSEAGFKLLPAVTEAFDTIRSAAARIRKPPSQLRIVASPTFANRRLIPQMSGFANDVPEVDITVRIQTGDVTALDLKNHDCGVVTTHDPNWPSGTKAVRIIAEALTPVCAPSLLAGMTLPITAGALKDMPLLSIINCPTDWPNWLSANDCSDVDIPLRGNALETAEMAIRAAVEGLGVIVMDRFLIETELRNGQLIDLFPDSRPVDNGYYFICDRHRWNDPIITAFHNWLVETMASKS